MSPSKALSTPVSSIMERAKSDLFLQNDTDCSSLLDKLQAIWNDIGESDVEKDAMLLELEKECLEIYRRKVDQANRHRAQIRQTIADSEAEIATICSAMGERPVHFRQNERSLKEELKSIIQQLDDLRETKNERLRQFLEVREQILCVSTEINPDHDLEIVVDESDLSIRKLEDLHSQLDMLHKEKNERLRKVLDHLITLNSLCLVLDIDFKHTASEVHPSLGGPDESKNISSDTIERLKRTIQRLREVKLQRMRMLQDLATAMLEMWHLMDTPIEEQQQFRNVTCNIAASEHEITKPMSLSIGFINRVEAEVTRLEKMKASKIKELVFKKKIELDELCRRTHLVAETDNYPGIEAIETESLNLSLVLEQMESQISIVKENAFSRKEILERVEKWFAACEEESWLDEYNRDENRYNAGRGTHLMLKRAEKARAVVNKIPGIVETLTTKILAWENERGTEFIYDGSSLLSMLQEYHNLRQEKEHERKRLRDQRRLQGQLIAGHELTFGSKPTLYKSQSAKKLTGTLLGGSTKRLSVGGATLQSPKFDSLPSFKSPFSKKKTDDLSRGMGDPESESFVPEAETPRKPFRPLSLPHSSPLTTPNKSRSEAEEENTMKSRTDLSATKQMNAKFDPPDFAREAAAAAAAKMKPQNREVSFEERRLALLFKVE